MAGLSIKAPDSFWGKADIPVHGAQPVKVDLHFAHMGREDLQAFVKATDRTDVQTLQAILRGWKPEQFDGAEFCVESLQSLCDQYMGAALVIYEAWLIELTQARRGN